MLKSLYPQVNWDLVQVVGFDLDGTLYDELEFILQVYLPISRELAATCGVNHEDIYEDIVALWLEKGSSYNRIFEEALHIHGIQESLRREVIFRCIQIFRSFQPQLMLTQRVSLLLNYFFRKFGLFLVSDGTAPLQSAKFHALGLERWLRKENIAFTGSFGPEYCKPSAKVSEKIGLLHAGYSPGEVVFFGDREIDREFASNAGFEYVPVYTLRSVGR